MSSRGHPFLRTLRLLVACLVWVFCHGPSTSPRQVDPVALVVTVSAAAHAAAEPAPEITAALPAPSREQQRTESPAPRSCPPPARIEEAAPSLDGDDTAPALPLYLRNCSLLC